MGLGGGYHGLERIGTQKPSEILAAALVLLAAESRWAKYSYAFASDGQPHAAHSLDACMWCSIGAVLRRGDLGHEENITTIAFLEAAIHTIVNDGGRVYRVN